jgi:hypothetical protein
METLIYNISLNGWSNHLTAKRLEKSVRNKCLEETANTGGCEEEMEGIGTLMIG